MEGVGSVWNAGNYHWEEKNYSQMIKDSLKHKLLQISLEDAPVISVKEVTTCDGSAAVNIRKGKTICVFEFEIKMKVDVDGNQVFIDIEDFTQEDDEVHMKIKEIEDYNTRKQVQNKLQKQFQQIAKQLKDELMNAENQKIEALKMQQQLEALKFKQMSPAQPVVNPPMPVIQKQESLGSEWNPNSYFWEERKITDWCDDYLKKNLENLKLEIPTGKFEITNVSCKGEGSSSIRKGKRIVVIDYEVTISFKANLLDGDFNEILSLTGDIDLLDLTIDSIKSQQYEVNIQFQSNLTTSQKDPGSELIIKVIQEKGFKVVHQALLQFAEEALNK